jgi:GDP-L-fucose synthase
MFNERRVLVTGGGGLVGRHLIKLLLESGAHVTAISHTRSPPSHLSEKIKVINGNLTESKFCNDIVKDIDYVFHTAAFIGGVKQNISHPATMISQNSIMNSNIIKASNDSNVERFLYMSCTCVYPDKDGLLKEDVSWNEPPSKSAVQFGWVKRMGELESKSYKEEFGLKTAIVRPANAFGPGDLYDKYRSHAVPALIMKAVAKIKPFKIWGDGTAKRDFLYAEDIARGAMLALEKYSIGEPINISTGNPVSINELATKILALSGNADVEIVHESHDLAGASSRVLDPTKAQEKLGFRPKFTLEEGLQKTIQSYVNGNG